jgi:hypothetical protein
LPAGYAELLENRKNRIRSAQVKAVVAVNRELLRLYWDIGREILQRQRQEGMGAKVIDRLGGELRRAFPAMKGLCRATSSTCGLSPRRTPMRQLCSRLLHNFSSSTTASSSTRSRRLPHSGNQVCWKEKQFERPSHSLGGCQPASTQ